MAMTEKKSYKVSCFGAGFVGIPTSAVLSLHNPSISVRKMILSLPSMILIVRGSKNAKKTDCVSDALREASVIFLALPTPTKNFGEQKGKAYDLSYTENAIRSIVKFYNENQMLNNVILV